jgi:hypothetical protein
LVKVTPCFRWRIQLAMAGCLGSLLTVLMAWACILWAPTRTVFDPFHSPAQAVETTDPDGVKGLHYQEHGFGWSYLYLRGDRTSPKTNVIWSGPYGGIYHRLAGWPFPALRSRVEVLDSQAASRFSEGTPEPAAIPQRRRWQLPWKEILRRGAATQDLPGWVHAKPGRRVPLIPLPWGLALDTLVLGMICLTAVGMSRFARRMIRGSGQEKGKSRPARRRRADYVVAVFARGTREDWCGR